MFKSLTLFAMLISGVCVYVNPVYAALDEAASPTENVDSVDLWFDKMAHAMTQQNYQGTLIIRQNNKLQAIKVKQGVTSGGGWQTLESLTGEDQTIIRQNNQVTTIFPGKKLVTVSGNEITNLAKTPLHQVLPENRRVIKRYYTLKLNGQDRVADKVTQIIQMIPRDKHRYGYTFWLDKHSGMLLKCDLMDVEGRVLEQLMYSNVELLTEAPENHVDTDELALFRKINLSDKSVVVAKSWQARQLPEGFTLTRSVKTQYSNQGTPTYHMVYSDGMASVSVFIEPHKKNGRSGIEQSSMGPVNVYSSFINEAYITAIGEVPASTVRMIAQSIHPVK